MINIKSAGSAKINFDDIYPVGSVYISVVSTNPSTFFGGTWEAIEGQFLLGCNSTYAAGTTGGSADHSHKYGFAFGAYYGEVSMENNGNAGSLKDGTGDPVGTEGYGSFSHIVNNSTTNSSKDVSMSHYKSIADTSTTSNLPPYLAVYMWKRTA